MRILVLRKAFPENYFFIIL